MKKKPNVIIFFTDQQRFDTSGLHGNPLGLTPNLDIAAKRGTHLYNFFTCQPVCGPARSVLQTGIYPTRTGCYTNGRPLPHDVKTLADYFKDEGYRTGYIGKWHLGGEEPVTKENRGGYDYWLGSELLEFVSDSYSTLLYDNDNNPVRLPGYRVDALTDAAIRYIDKNQEEPFFLFLSLLEPHHQNHRDDYPAPDGYAEKYTGRWTPPDLMTLGGSSGYQLGGYFGIVKRIDEAYGRLLDAVKSLGIEDSTIVLFTSDHGNHFKTRNSEYKRSGHEASIRVPCVITGPGFNNKGQKDELISIIDLPPTLLDATGIPIPDIMQGKSAMPMINSCDEKRENEVLVQISESQVARALRTERWKYIIEAKDKDPMKDSSSDRYEEIELYDLVADPYELDNLIGKESFSGVIEKLRNRIIKLMMEAGEKELIIKSAPKRNSGQRSATNNKDTDQRIVF